MAVGSWQSGAVRIDSREVQAGDLFVGLAGENVDGSAFARQALDAGAWGVVVREGSGLEGNVFEVPDPLAELQRLAREWRRELGCPAIGIAGSTGKTSTKDILAAMLRPAKRVHATPENWNTEIGLPLTILAAKRGTEVLVLEMAMRGEGQVAELARTAAPQVGLVLNVGPEHLELLGTVERVAATNAELIAELPADGTAVLPAAEPLLEPYRRADIDTVTFGPGGDVTEADLAALELPFTEPHNILNACAALACARAVGVDPSGPIDVEFSKLRGEEVELPGGVTVVLDCYNANPMSMRAALENLASAPAARRIAVLGGMLELGEESARYHREAGEQAGESDILITVGELAIGYLDGYDGEHYSVATPEEAGALLDEVSEAGDRVLLKGSRGIGLERVLG
ncbi:MAG: UDP-N-acetylmuramoyl-tripeptide--D-alanyl-D-alanine ligase [Thermoleophilaceae bacterium]|nr:UDP-N-acetylmuramoyl-tripeptide--D-alanyl-D-alanine ligase [Thermoleophilaceae bacterium]